MVALLLLVVKITMLLYRYEAVSRMCSLNSTADKIPTMMESRIAKSFIRGRSGRVHLLYTT